MSNIWYLFLLVVLKGNLLYFPHYYKVFYIHFANDRIAHKHVHWRLIGTGLAWEKSNLRIDPLKSFGPVTPFTDGEHVFIYGILCSVIKLFLFLCKIII